MTALLETSTGDITPEQAERLFDVGSFFLLEDLPRGSEFGVDGKLWQVNKFSGVKFIPPGLHMFVCSATPEIKEPSLGETTVGSIGIRHCLFKYFDGRSSECVTRRWNPQSESLESIHPNRSNLVVTTNSRKAAKRPRFDDYATTPTSTAATTTTSTTTTNSSSSSNSNDSTWSENIVSKEHLKTLDPELAPFPFQVQQVWKNLTGYIDSNCLERVIKSGSLSSSNDFVVNSVTPTLTDIKEIGLGQHSEGRIWSRKKENDNDKDQDHDGKAAGTADNSEEQQDDDSVQQESNDERLQFASFDLRRSWRPGAVGEEVTKDSLDKTNLLCRITESQWNNDPNQVLAEIQLSFILFCFVHNFSSLDIYKKLVSLLSQSKSLVNSSTSSSTCSYKLLLIYLKEILPNQLKSLRPEFFREDLPGFDAFLLDQIENVRKNLRESDFYFNQGHLQEPHNTTTSTSTSTSSKPQIASDYLDEDEEDDENDKEMNALEKDQIWKEFREAWEQIRKITKEKFEWYLPSIEVAQTSTRQTTHVINDPTQTPNRASDPNQPQRLYYDFWRQNRGESDEEYVEMGEDAPVLVLDVDQDDL